ncbi:MAG: hypothetical protein KJO18_08515, partial [Acidimicrobiia bacterium]|nr:hypothetical protein [Acidimicrobiia bacterium]
MGRIDGRFVAVPDRGRAAVKDALQERETGRTVAAASLWVTAGIVTGRLVGLLRELMIADSFGANREADMAILLVSVPDTIVTIVSSGAIGLVLIPILLDHDRATQIALLRHLTVRVIAVSAALTAIFAFLVIFAATDWARRSGVQSDTFQLATILAATALPPSIAVALTMAFLRARDRFAISSFATATFNLPILCALLLRSSLVWLGAGLAAGGLLRYGTQVVAIGREWLVRRTNTVQLTGQISRSTYLAAVASNAAVALQLALPLGIATVIGNAGDVALLNFGSKLLLVPIGLLGTVISVAAYPSIIRMVSAAQRLSRTQQRQLHALIRPFVYLAAAIASWLWVNGDAFASFVYGRTALDSDDLRLIGSELRYGAASVLLLTLGAAATAILHGTKNPGRALLGYLVSSPVLLGVGIVLFRSHGPNGMMVAFSVYSFVFCVASITVLHVHRGFSPLAPRELIVG